MILVRTALSPNAGLKPDLAPTFLRTEWVRTALSPNAGLKRLGGSLIAWDANRSEQR